MIDTIRLSHGSGRGLDELLREIVLPGLYGDFAGPFEDAAVVNLPAGRAAFTTDSFVVQPLEFKGGNIGTLAACGTINDLAMMAARPLLMSVSLILEEGLDAAVLARMIKSLRDECDAAGVAVVCGDTKVVDRGKADAMFVTTSGIGMVREGANVSVANARPGDSVLVSGPIGRHGIAIMAARKGLNFASTVTSDCASLHRLVEALLDAAPNTRTMRDATRGGCAAVLNEIAAASKATVSIRQDALPVTPEVGSACSFLGLDALHVANEGTFIAVVPADQAEKAIAAMRCHDIGRGAAIIGTVKEKGRFGAVMETIIGGTRVIDVPAGELLPRIC
jgi:hydrogenase expression/formation protein HypE